MRYPLFDSCFIPPGGEYHDSERPDHDGLDLTAKDINNPPMVPSMEAGVVLYANKGAGAYGTQETIVIVQHDGYWSSYGHLQHGSPVVRAGQRVEKYQDLGRMGFSGYTIPADKRATHTHICTGPVWRNSITNSPKFNPMTKLQGGSDDMTNEQIVRAAAKGLQFTPDYPDEATANWVGHLDAGGDLATMLRTFAVESLQFYSDTEILEIFQEIRERNGYHYPGGATQFAKDRVDGGSTARQVLEGDIAYYMQLEAKANAQPVKTAPTPLSPQDQKDLLLGRGFRAIVKEVHAS